VEHGQLGMFPRTEARRGRAQELSQESSARGSVRGQSTASARGRDSKRRGMSPEIWGRGNLREGAARGTVSLHGRADHCTRTWREAGTEEMMTPLSPSPLPAC